MKILLGGWSGSKKVISACSYLLNKYVPEDFGVFFLNVGSFSGDLPRGTYVNVGTDDSPQGWIKNITVYLENLSDKYIILGDDDFFMSQPINMQSFGDLFSKMVNDENIGCAKLCISLFHKTSEYNKLDHELFMLNETSEWSAVVQFCIWDRLLLIDLLKKSHNPWEFETEGSKRLNATGRKVIAAFDAPFMYPDRSALSKTHPGKVSVLGNKKEDVEELIQKGYLNRDELVMGMWGGEVLPYGDGTINPYECLAACSDKEYVKKTLDICLKK